MARLEQDMIVFEDDGSTKERAKGRRAMSHEEFVRKVAEINKSLEVMGKYVNSNTKIRIKCRDCEREWETRPNDIRRISCAKCNRYDLTHEDFIQKVRANPNNDSLTILGTYSGANKTVLCKCSRCGEEWEPRPNALYSGNGCKRCFSASRNAPKFFEKMAKNHPTIEIGGEYINGKSMLHCKCKVCEYEWDAAAYVLSNIRGCKVCAGALLTHEIFAKRLADINPTVEAVGKYQSVRIPIDCRCRICGHEWSTTPNILIAHDHPSACPACAKEKNTQNIIVEALKKRKTHEEFMKEMAELAPTITVLGEYKNYSTKIPCRCNLCGFEWESVPSCLRDGRCPQCASQRRADFFRKPREQFINEIASVNPSVRIVGEYVNDNTKTEFQCMRCKHVWMTSPGSVLRQRSGCPECNNKQTSFVEKAVLLFLRKTLGDENVTSRDRSIGRELDVYAKSKNIAIEYGSWYWHKKRVEEDKERLRLCRNLGIDLIVIYDGFDDDVNEYGLNDAAFILYHKPLSTLRMRNELISCIKNIYRRFDLNYSFSKKEEDELFIQAKLATARKTTEEVTHELLEINPDIELLDKYKDTETPMLCRCKKCGHEWSANYNSLIRRKSKCPMCGRSKYRVVDLDTGEIFESAKIASLRFEITSAAIGRICKQRTKTYNGHHLAYLEDLSKSQINELHKLYPDMFND